MCGLINRLKIPEFIELINKYDVFVCSECKIDNLDVINVNGYSFLSQPRKQQYLRQSGGVGFFLSKTALTISLKYYQQILITYFG